MGSNPPRALRIVVLVAVSMSAGYLWRAAFEAPRANREALGGGSTAVVRFDDRAPRFTTPARRSAERRRAAPAAHASTSRPAHSLPLRGVGSSAPRQEATRVVPRSGGATGRPKPTSPSASAPSPPPASAAPPTSAPAPAPAVSQPPPATPSTPPAPPTPSPSPPPVTTPTPAPGSAGADDASAGTRPGYGKGDPNHTHTGPPGKSG